MKKFQFSLDTVLDYKQQVLTSLQSEHGAILLRVRQQEEVLEQTEHAHRELNEEFTRRRAEGISIKDALMLESANDAAAAIACEVAGSVDDFAALMNEKAEELGLSNTHFTNPHGLDNEEHYTSAADLGKLASAAMQNETFKKIVSTYKNKIPLNGSEGTRVLVNHNRLLQSYDGTIGVKTGFTKRSGRCLVSAAERDGVTLVAVTLNDPDDWKDHKTMLDYGFSMYQRYTLAEEGALTFNIPCTGGQKDCITATNKDSLSLSLPKSGGPITTVLEAEQFLYAPIKKGALVGYTVFLRDGQEIGRVPMYADAACPTVKLQKGIFQFFK